MLSLIIFLFSSSYLLFFDNLGITIFFFFFFLEILQCHFTFPILIRVLFRIFRKFTNVFVYLGIHVNSFLSFSALLFQRYVTSMKVQTNIKLHLA